VTNATRLLQLVGGLAFLACGRRVADEAPTTPQPAPPDIVEIPVDTLSDAALAVPDSVHPIIYYNPARLQELGPALAIFLLTHERGHIRLQHRTAGALGAGSPTRNAVMLAQELDADCYAAWTLSKADHSAVDAAVRFFRRLGPMRFDAVHPTGYARAERIQQCSARRPAATRRPAGTPPDAGLSRTTGAPVSIRVMLPTMGSSTPADVHLWIDDLDVGTISNIQQPRQLTLNQFSAGSHRYRLLVAQYDLDQLLQLNRSGTLMASGQVVIAEGEEFSVVLSKGAEPEFTRLQ
jgi:hypothetical protein